MSPDDKRTTLGEAGQGAAAGSAARRLPLTSHRPHVIAPAAALIPQSGSNAAVWTTGTAQLPRRQAVELLTQMVHAPVAATRAAW